MSAPQTKSELPKNGASTRLAAISTPSSTAPQTKTAAVIAAARTSTFPTRTPYVRRSRSEPKKGAAPGGTAPLGSARLRNDPDVRLRRLPALRIRLLRLVVGDGPGDDHVVALLPLRRRCNLVRRGQLQRIDHAQ